MDSPVHRARVRKIANGVTTITVVRLLLEANGRNACAISVNVFPIASIVLIRARIAIGVHIPTRFVSHPVKAAKTL